MKINRLFLFLLLCFCIKYDLFASKESAELFEPLRKMMIERGADSNFVEKLLNHPSVKFNEKFVKINVMGFLGKANYSKHFNKRSIKKTTKFLREHVDLLQASEDRFGVPKEVISSVLWIETRHGGYTGKNHMPSVFLSTAMASQDKYIEMNIEGLHKKFKGSKKEKDSLEKKIKARAKKKTNWAVTELLALQKLDSISPIPIFEIKGSWAGAFGLSQFLPSSYMNWAVDGDNDNKINLFEKADAIFSVGNYLKTNGWGKTKKAKRKAVFHYNNSRAYVDAVLTLARKVKIAYQKEQIQRKRINIKTPLKKQVK